MALKRRAEVDAFCFAFVFTRCSHSGSRQPSHASKRGWMALERSRGSGAKPARRLGGFQMMRIAFD